MTACPYCGGAPGRRAYPYETEWNGRIFAYHQCASCGITFVDPLPGQAELDALFAPEAYHQLFYAGEAPTAEQCETLDWMRPLVPAGARLLDVGCGNGAFLRAAAEAGYEVAGVEQNEGSIAFAAQRSCVPVTDLGTALAAGARYDIVHLADVLSHLPQPAEMLRALERLLAPGGLFLIEGPLEKQPNPVYIALLAAARLRRRRGAHAPLHLSFTSWKSQRAFLERQLGYRLIASDLYETGWPFSIGPGGGIGGRGKAAIARFAILLSRSRLGRGLGAFNRFRALLDPVSRS